MAELSDRELLEELGVAVETKAVAIRTPREERIIAGFEDILKFVDKHGRAPQPTEDRDIFERLCAVRLERIRAQADCQQLVAHLDTHGLLSGGVGVAEGQAEFKDDASLLAELGVVPPAEVDITVLRHVKSRDEVRAAEEIAQRERCEDFDQFKPLFDQMQAELAAGVREAREFGRDPSVAQGDFFILSGQVVYVADMGEAIKAPNGESDARLRVIFANGTQSNLLRRSLQRALYKDETGRRITVPSAGPLFGASSEGEDLESGTIYVLRSKSNHPDVAAHRNLIHKIGVTGGSVETRISQAVNDATYLLAEVEIVATYKLFNINRGKLENLLHRVFAPARIDLTIEDRFGRAVQPKEWYLVPLAAIDEAVAKVRDGSITQFTYDPTSATLIGNVANT
ncbi:hypothetical protein ASD21_05265 [Caulobacter sp. Root1455]|uniref:GIY-YIG nuclease family protein n=1 Tax=Caulobacter sp. Root1455 TaxID=1736465 RepID=UPI0006FEC4E4|nr:GIY-YIG nuclease family protein [Caulobacter sp. Root1455]KQY95920.1 hypothetical protein ASD21_05265 [Caulobacter sp. Root1455]